jgi:hypothetical protein
MSLLVSDDNRKQADAQRPTLSVVHATGDEDRMMWWIARTAREAREAAGRLKSHVAAELAADQTRIGRFETGEMREIDVDEIVNAYSRDLDLAPCELWRRAVDSWCAANGSTAPP